MRIRFGEKKAVTLLQKHQIRTDQIELVTLKSQILLKKVEICQNAEDSHPCLIQRIPYQRFFLHLEQEVAVSLSLTQIINLRLEIYARLKKKKSLRINFIQQGKQVINK